MKPGVEMEAEGISSLANSTWAGADEFAPSGRGELVSGPRIKCSKESFFLFLQSFSSGLRLGLNGSSVRPSHMQNSSHPSAGPAKMKRTHTHTQTPAHTSQSITRALTSGPRHTHIRRHTHAHKAWRGIRGAIHFGEKSSYWTVQRPRQGNNQHQCVCQCVHMYVCVRVIVLMVWWKCVCDCVLHYCLTVVNCTAAISWEQYARFVLLCADE